VQGPNAFALRAQDQITIHNAVLILLQILATARSDTKRKYHHCS
jgi:hypothetical protein